MCDLAFHALREYQPGDDRRYIHWRSLGQARTGCSCGSSSTPGARTSPCVVDTSPEVYARRRG